MYEYQLYKDNLPAFEKLDNISERKRKIPQWLFVLIISMGSTAVLIAIFACLILPNLREPTTIHYSSENQTSSAQMGINAENVGWIAEAAGKCIPSTVYISSTGIVGGFFSQQVSLGSGSGIIVSDNGYIVTSSSVVNSGTEISVTLSDGQKVSAMVVGNDAKTDVAVLKIDADGLIPSVLGNSENVNIGDEIITVGNPLGPQITNTVTAGIIAGINNNVTFSNGTTLNFLQTDANVSSGNTGGAIFNTAGEVIGIIAGNISSDSEIALAIPINDIKPLLSSFLGGGVSDSSGGEVNDTPMLGITGTGEKYGVVVETVSENYPAAKAGVQKGDIIIKADGTPVTTVEKLNEIRISHKRGDVLVLTVFRGGETLEISVTLE